MSSSLSDLSIPCGIIDTLDVENGFVEIATAKEAIVETDNFMPRPL